MNPNKIKFHCVYLIGLGGIGSHLAEGLCRLLAFHENGTTDMTFIDGDKFEEGNAVRQLFNKSEEGTNKATATAKRLAFMPKPIRVMPMFIDENIMADEFATARMRHEETYGYQSDFNILVITAVDNIATRKAVIVALKAVAPENFFLVDPGNELETGSVAVWAKRKGVELIPDPTVQYPGMYDHPPDEIPGSCSKKTASTPQLITANMGAAWLTLVLIEHMMSGKPWYDTVRFSCPRFKMAVDGDPVNIDPQKKEIVAKEEITLPAEAIPEKAVATAGV